MKGLAILGIVLLLGGLAAAVGALYAVQTLR